MDSLMYPGTDKLWPTRVADPPPSSAFVDLTSQNEPYHRNQGTCRYGECIEASCRYFFIHNTAVSRQMTKIFSTTSLHVSQLDIYSNLGKI